MKHTSRIASFLAAGAILALPAIALAQTGINTAYITPYSTGIINVINQILVPVLMAIAFIVFLWGVYKYFILGAANEEDRANGRQFVLWGVIGFVVIVCLWGLVYLVMGTLGLSTGTAPAFPTIGGSSSSSTNSTAFTGIGTIGGNGGTVGTYGSNIFGSNGTYLGQVNSSGQIIGANGQVVGRRLANGQIVDTSGNSISGAREGRPAGSSCTGDSSGSCPSGFTCEVTAGEHECAADTTTGSGSNSCVSTGCSDGEVCNQSTGACVADTSGNGSNGCATTGCSDGEVCSASTNTCVLEAHVDETPDPSECTDPDGC